MVNKEELSAHVKLEANQYGEKWAMVLFLVNQVKPGEFQQNTTRNSAQKTFVPIWSLLFKNQSNRMIVFITMAFVCIGWFYKERKKKTTIDSSKDENVNSNYRDSAEFFVTDLNSSLC